MDIDRLSHAYIASGALAETIATAAVCTCRGVKPCMNCVHCYKASRGVHPDIITVNKLPDKREIVVDQIRELKKDVIIIPNESEKRVYIVNSADTMNRNAQNAFLQILEEPPAHVVFILRTDNPAALLPTVRSRCVELKARYEPAAVDSVAEKMAEELYSAIERGNVALTMLMFRLEKLEKETFAEFLPASRALVAAKLREYSPDGGILFREKLAKAERLLFRAGEMLDLNVSTGHISGMICAGLMKVES